MKSITVTVTLSALVLMLSAALVIQALAGRHRRHEINQTAIEICVKHDQGLDVLHDIIVLASTPPPGKRLTSDQVKAITRFQTKAFARIDAARC